jgi:uncharacterized protein (DUF849 family)
VLLQATLNGPLTKADHPAVPTSLAELVRDARRCAIAGAGAFHVHPRDDDGREALTPRIVDVTAAEISDATGLPVGVTTGEWIEPDLARRVWLIGSWTAPAFATVNLSEAGSGSVMKALLDADIGVEAGVWTVADVERLAASGLAERVLRVCVEPVDLRAADAIGIVDEIHAALDAAGIDAPRLQHGDGEATWVLLTDAIRRGIATRIGFEDTVLLPDGIRAPDNEALVHAARHLGAAEA